MVAKPFDAGGGGIARNGGRTEGIDGGLNEHVGDGEHAALQTGGDADAQNQNEGAALDARFFRLEADIAVAGDQAGEDKRRADELADDGRDGDARDAELQPGDEQHVEDDIDHAADGQVIQRALGIADGAKDGRAIVIDEAGGQADGVNIEIELCAGQHVFGAAHQFQQRGGEEQQQRAEQHAGKNGQRHGGMHRAAHAVPVSGSGRAGRRPRTRRRSDPSAC